MKSLYGELSQVKLSTAINTMVELSLPRGTKDKVLVIPVRIEAENFETNDHKSENFNILYFRPNNYTFVGVSLSSEVIFPDRILSEVKRYSYHDSCWRGDGTDHIIGLFVDKLNNSCDQTCLQNYSVYTDFGFGPKLIDGRIDITEYTSKENSKFIPLKKIIE